jgi:UDP-N-acetylglucosamine 2-epimerase
MYDAMLLSLNIARDRSKIMDTLGLMPKGYYLATIHRAENTDDDKRLCSILEAFNEIAGEKEIILPLHPRTRKIMGEIGDLKINPRVRICEPVGYLDMLILEQNASRIFTDSGGVQKEAYFFGVPCITLRDQTEWMETVVDGMNTVTGAIKERIIEVNKVTHKPQSTLVAYGDGKASERILLTLLNLAKI